MVHIEIPLQSYLVNAALILVLELLLVLFGGQIYREFINASCRSRLLAGNKVAVYGREWKSRFVVFSLLIFATAIAIELGFEGESVDDLNALLHPQPSVFLSNESDWAVQEDLDKRLSEISLLDFQPSPERTRCLKVREGRRSFTEFGMYGREGCYRYLVKESSRDTLTSDFKWVDVVNSTNVSITLASTVQRQFSKDYGVLRFRKETDESEVVEQLSISFLAVLETSSEDSAEFSSPNNDPQKVTISVLKDWNYTARSGREERENLVTMVAEAGPFRAFFNVFRFRDLFKPTVATDAASIIPIKSLYNVPLFPIETYSLRGVSDASNPRTQSHVLIRDPSIVRARKAYYALSKLHFLMDPSEEDMLRYSLQIMSSIDGRLPENSRTHSSQIILARSSDTRINVLSLVALGAAIILLISSKGYFHVVRRRAPFSVNVFDNLYIARSRMPKEDERDSGRNRAVQNEVLELENGKYPIFKLSTQFTEKAKAQDDVYW